MPLAKHEVNKQKGKTHYPMRRELTSWAKQIYETVKVEFDTAIACK